MYRVRIWFGAHKSAITHCCVGGSLASSVQKSLEIVMPEVWFTTVESREHWVRTHTRAHTHFGPVHTQKGQRPLRWGSSLSQQDSTLRYPFPSLSLKHSTEHTIEFRLFRPVFTDNRFLHKVSPDLHLISPLLSLLFLFLPLNVLDHFTSFCILHEGKILAPLLRNLIPQLLLSRGILIC